MTGGGGRKTIVPQEPDPSPTPVIAEEAEGAKKKVRKKKRGRSANILAGRMMTKHKQILKTDLGE